MQFYTAIRYVAAHGRVFSPHDVCMTWRSLASANLQWSETLQQQGGEQGGLDERDVPGPESPGPTACSLIRCAASGPGGSKAAAASPCHPSSASPPKGAAAGKLRPGGGHPPLVSHQRPGGGQTPFASHRRPPCCAPGCISHSHHHQSEARDVFVLRPPPAVPLATTGSTPAGSFTHSGLGGCGKRARATLMGGRCGSGRQQTPRQLAAMQRAEAAAAASRAVNGGDRRDVFSRLWRFVIGR